MSSERPQSIEDLFAHPISDDPVPGRPFDAGWAEQNQDRKRFYVAGFREFRDLTNITTLHDYKQMALDEIKQTGWMRKGDKYVGSHVNWTSIAREQYVNAMRYISRSTRMKNRTPPPLYFEKAALVILSAEMCLRTKKYDNPCQVYAILKILPASWNINRLNDLFLESLRENSAFDEILTQLALALEWDENDTWKTLEQHAQGGTLTRENALKIDRFFRSHKDQFGIQLEPTWRVRCTAGRRILGHHHACSAQELSL